MTFRVVRQAASNTRAEPVSRCRTRNGTGDDWVNRYLDRELFAVWPTRLCVAMH